MITIGSLFSGIGGFELGLERAIPNAKTIWQVEQNEFCKKILKQHWADAQIYNDVRDITSNNVERVDILCGGFPCQDISIAAAREREGINGTRSSLWWEMHRIINELQPCVAVMENVPAITFRGLGAVLGSLSEIGYNAEWCTIRASDFSAPHKRERWFCIAYATNTNSQRSSQQSMHNIAMETERLSECRSSENSRIYCGNHWEKFPIEPSLCRGDDGVSHRMDRIKALGNAIVPQCSEWIGHQIVQSGLLDDLLEVK